MNLISVLLILSCLLLLGSSRLHVAIRVVAIQGVLLAVLPIIRSWGDIPLGIWVLGLSTILSKGVALPWLMTVCLRHTGLRGRQSLQERAGTGVHRRLSPAAGHDEPGDSESALSPAVGGD